MGRPGVVVSRALVAGAVLLRGASASADVTVEPERKLALYAEVSLFGGRLANTMPNPAYETATSVRGARWALGGQLELPSCVVVRGGATVEAFDTGSWAAAFGGELQLDGPVFTPSLRLGGRVAVASSEGGGCAECGDGVLMMIGPRARIQPFVVGIDLVRVSGDGVDANGFEVSAGLGGRPGKTAIAASAIGGAVLGIVMLVIFSQAQTH